MMLATAALLALAAHLVNAFKGTSPVIAWSDHDLSSLDQLVPKSLSLDSSSQVSFLSKKPTPDSFASISKDDLCSLSSILLISVPGLHASDLQCIPTSSSSHRSLKRSLQDAVSKVHRSYVPEEVAEARVERLVSGFVSLCGAEIDGVGEKTVTSRVIDGLDRDKIGTLQDLESTISRTLHYLPSSHLVVITGSRSVPSPSHQKRQLPVTTFQQSNSSNHTLPGPNSPVLERYVLINPPLIVGILIVVGVLIPAVLLSINALSMLDTPEGLKGKMKGTTGEAKKD